MKPFTFRAGHLEWEHWLHGTAIPPFPTYFSGAPVIYPPLGALANAVGGLVGARMLSLCFMLGTTVLLYATTSRLFNRRAGGYAAAIFAALGPVQVLSAFATYDAMAIFLIALATWLMVRARGVGGEWFLIASGLVLALADATKYASALWTPVVVILAVMTETRSGWVRPVLAGGPLRHLCHCATSDSAAGLWRQALHARLDGQHGQPSGGRHASAYHLERFTQVDRHRHGICLGRNGSAALWCQVASGGFASR